MWSIEPLAIPYYDVGTRRFRKYYPDFFVKFSDGREYLIEIKPAAECKPPKGKRRTKHLIIAEQTYETNQSKWKAAKQMCKEKGWVFRVLDENALKEMGLKIIPSRIKKQTKKPQTKKTQAKKSQTKKKR
jgi:hypothetical protein